MLYEEYLNGMASLVKEGKVDVLDDIVDAVTEMKGI